MIHASSHADVKALSQMSTTMPSRCGHCGKLMAAQPDGYFACKPCQKFVSQCSLWSVRRVPWEVIAVARDLTTGHGRDCVAPARSLGSPQPPARARPVPLVPGLRPRRARGAHAHVVCAIGTVPRRLWPPVRHHVSRRVVGAVRSDDARADVVAEPNDRSPANSAMTMANGARVGRGHRAGQRGAADRKKSGRWRLVHACTLFFAVFFFLFLKASHVTLHYVVCSGPEGPAWIGPLRPWLPMCGLASFPAWPRTARRRQQSVRSPTRPCGI